MEMDEEALIGDVVSARVTLFNQHVAHATDQCAALVMLACALYSQAVTVLAATVGGDEDEAARILVGTEIAARRMGA
nr:hypothetical protein [uncultured Rhodopila sp.]